MQDWWCIGSHSSSHYCTTYLVSLILVRHTVATYIRTYVYSCAHSCTPSKKYVTSEYIYMYIRTYIYLKSICITKGKTMQVSFARQRDQSQFTGFTAGSVKVFTRTNPSYFGQPRLHIQVAEPVGKVQLVNNP